MSVKPNKSSVGLREESFSILFDRESGEAVIPSSKEELLLACGLLIESAMLESPHSDCESTRWMELLEKLGSISSSDGFVAMAEGGNMEAAKELFSETWTIAVTNGQI